MKLIVGLGNPGSQYDRTRHNAGFLVVDELARRHAAGGIARSRFHAATLDASIAGEKVVLMKPTTFMNRSGQSVGEAVRFFKLDPSEDLLVIVDEVALPVGHVRVKKSGGTGGHNGLSDIDRLLGGQPYPRVRVGVGAMPTGWVLADWVLSRFDEDEQGSVKEGVRTAADASECVLDEGISAAMNRFNRKAEKPAEDKPEYKKQDTPGRDDAHNNGDAA